MLEIPRRAEFEHMLSGCGEQIAGFLRRGMRSTAKTGINGYRNLAESIAYEYPTAAEARETGRGVARSTKLIDAVEWLESIGDPIVRAYAVLGFTDELFP